MLVVILIPQVSGRSHLMSLLAQVELDSSSIQFAFQAFLEILTVSAHLQRFLSTDETIFKTAEVLGICAACSILRKKIILYLFHIFGFWKSCEQFNSVFINTEVYKRYTSIMLKTCGP